MQCIGEALCEGCVLIFQELPKGAEKKATRVFLYILEALLCLSAPVLLAVGIYFLTKDKTVAGGIMVGIACFLFVAFVVFVGLAARAYKKRKLAMKAETDTRDNAYRAGVLQDDPLCVKPQAVAENGAANSSETETDENQARNEESEEIENHE